MCFKRNYSNNLCLQFFILIIYFYACLEALLSTLYREVIVTFLIFWGYVNKGTTVIDSGKVTWTGAIHISRFTTTIPFHALSLIHQFRVPVSFLFYFSLFKLLIFGLYHSSYSFNKNKIRNSIRWVTFSFMFNSIIPVWWSCT